MRTTKIVSTNKFIGALIFVFIICTPAFALTPEIYSMEPDYGANDSPTDITVHGDNFEPIPDMAMATYMANRLDADPVWIFFNGPPASSKTEILMSMKNHRETFFLSALTKNTFLSGKSKKDKDTGEEKDCSLLPYMTGKLVVIKDFTTVLSLQKDARAEIYSQLREIYDGHFAKAFGAGDGRKSWDGKNRHHLRSNPRH